MDFAFEFRRLHLLVCPNSGSECLLMLVSLALGVQKRLSFGYYRYPENGHIRITDNFASMTQAFRLHKSWRG